MNKLYKAAYAKAVAQKEEALATFEIYFNTAAGIGEHPDLLTEVDKYVELLAGANDKIEALKLYAQEETSQEATN
jgi:hypothetical protein